MPTIWDLAFQMFVNPNSGFPSVRVTDSTITARSQLAQARPSDTNATSILSPGTDESYIIATIIVANTSSSDVTYRIFHDDDGTTYDETTALYYDITIRANSSHPIDLFVAMNDETGNFAVRTSSANALTFTLYGATL